MSAELQTAPAAEAKAPMKCPSCRTDSGAPTARCAHCKLTLRSLDPKFGAVPRHSRYLTDRHESLPPQELEPLRERLRLFHRKFPQSLFSVFVVELPAAWSISEYAFWLANRARFDSDEGKLEDNFSLLMVIDAANRAAALTIGYGLEPYLNEADLESVLAAATDPLRGDNLVGGIRAAIEAMTDCMRGNVKRVERSAARR